MKIWIDIDNAPHVNFMEPIIKGLKESGVKTIITARDYAQTIPLLRMKNLNFIRIDGDYSLPRILYTFQRAHKLYKFLRNSNIYTGFSHGSRSMAIAGRMLGVKTVVTFDYEYVEHKIFNLFATKLLLPEALNRNSLNKMGYNFQKIKFYPGYKEEVYLSNFIADRLFPQKLKIDSDKIIISARPPADKSHYFSQSINTLFWETIGYVAKKPLVRVYIIPRYRDSIDDIETISKNIGKNIIVLKKAVKGLDLLWHSDLFIGAGGTMNRESALLGTPSYSLFYKKGGIDKSLEDKGLLHFIQHKSDISKIKIEKKGNIPKPSFSNLKDFFINYLTALG